MKKLFIIVLVTFLNSILSVNAMERVGNQRPEAGEIPDQVIQAGTISKELVSSNALNTLSQVDLQEAGAKIIGDHAWNRCENLTLIILPHGCTIIEQGAFHLCSNLEEVIFPAGLIRIGDGVFDDCTNLGAITLPASLQQVGKKAFRHCYKARVTVHARKTEVQMDTVGSWQTTEGRGPFADCRSVTWENG